MEAAQGWMQVGRGMKPHDEGCCCRCCHFGLLYQYQQRSWLEMQTGSQVICGPPCHCNSNKQGTYQSWKDQNQIQKREQVAPRYCLTIANSCGHQFLFSFPLPFTMAFLFPFCYFQSREPITSHSNTLSTSHPLTIPFRGALALSQRINRAYRQKECLISYHILAPL